MVRALTAHFTENSTPPAGEDIPPGALQRLSPYIWLEEHAQFMFPWALRKIGAGAQSLRRSTSSTVPDMKVGRTPWSAAGPWPAL